MTVYSPKEDSYLLSNYLEDLDLEGEKVLDMGTGSGIQAFKMAEKNAEVMAVDINPEAVEQAEEAAEENGLEIDFRVSDMFENVEGEFDLVVFNPPYLAGEKGVGDEEIWRGGEKGTEIPEKFLENVSGYLSSRGKALLVLSSLSSYEELVEKFDLEIVKQKELWFETLFLAEYK